MLNFFSPWRREVLAICRYGRKKFVLAAPLYLALSRLLLATRPSMGLYVKYRVIQTLVMMPFWNALQVWSVAPPLRWHFCVRTKLSQLGWLLFIFVISEFVFDVSA